MRNPLRSEGEAYRLLWIVVGGAALIIAAAFINTWLGVAVAVIAGAIVIAALAYANKWVGVAAAVLVVGGIGWWLWRSPPARRSSRERVVLAATRWRQPVRPARSARTSTSSRRS